MVAVTAVRQQDAAVAVLVKGRSQAEAARYAGVSRRTILRWLADEGFYSKLSGAMESLRETMVESVEIVPKGARSLVVLLNHHSPRVRLRTAAHIRKQYYDLCFRTEEQENEPDFGPPQARPLLPIFKPVMVSMTELLANENTRVALRAAEELRLWYAMSIRITARSKREHGKLVRRLLKIPRKFALGLYPRDFLEERLGRVLRANNNNSATN